MPRPYNHVVKTEFDTILNKAIGKKIKEARLNHIVFVKTFDIETKNIWSTPKKTPLTQTKLANALRPPKTFQQIQKYEKGTNSCSGFTMLCLFKGLGVSIPELIKIYLSVPIKEIQGQNKPEKILLGQNQTPNNLSRSSDYVDVDTQSKSV